jgi:hypothetical protein
MLIGPLPHNPGGCIPGGAAKVATTPMGGFTMPSASSTSRFRAARWAAVPAS